MELQIVWYIFNSIFEVHHILAHDIVYHKAFSEPLTVVIQSIANRVVCIHLSTIISSIKFFGRSNKSLPPFPLLHITDQCWNKKTISCTTTTKNTSSVLITSID